MSERESLLAARMRGLCFECLSELEPRMFTTDDNHSYGAAVVISAEAHAALIAVAEAAEEFVEARWLGSRDRLTEALARFDFGGCVPTRDTKSPFKHPCMSDRG